MATFKYNNDNSVLNTDAWDHHTFKTVYDTANKFKENIDTFAKKDNNKFGLMGDVFSSLYKHTPMLKSEFNKLLGSVGEVDETVDADDLLKQIMAENNINALEPTEPTNPNEFLMQKVLENQEYIKLHEMAMGDKLHSALSTMAMGEEISAWLQEQEQNKDFKNAQQQQKQAQKALDDANKKIEQREEQGKNPTKAQLNAQEQAQQALNAANQQLLKQMEQAMDGDSMGKMIAKASQKANDTKESTKDLLGGAGTGEAELKKLPLDAQIAVADLVRNNKKVQDIAEMAGKFKAIAKKKQKQKHTETIERSGLTLGNDVERLVPQELAYYRNQSTKLEFLKRFSESQAIQYSPKGKEVLGKGAIVVCLDESGSMHSLNAQSKGFVIALAMIARKQKRDLIVLPFSTKVGDAVKCEKGKVTSQNIVDLATKFLGGGTEFKKVLETAKETIETAKRFKKADIIFVTDGDPSDTNYLNKYMPEFLAFKRKHDVNIISLLIGKEPSKHYVEPFSDKIIQAADFMNEDAQDILSI